MKTLFHNGKILTLAEPLYAQAVLVEDGKIIGVGTEAELSGAADERIDLKGATLLPGFVDAHSHLTEYAISSIELNVDGISDLATLKEAIYAYIRDNEIPEGEWVVVRNYEHTLFPGGQTTHPGAIGRDLSPAPAAD